MVPERVPFFYIFYSLCYINIINLKEALSFMNNTLTEENINKLKEEL